VAIIASGQARPDGTGAAVALASGDAARGAGDGARGMGALGACGTPVLRTPLEVAAIPTVEHRTAAPAPETERGAGTGFASPAIPERGGAPPRGSALGGGAVAARPGGGSLAEEGCDEDEVGGTT